jgi:hypothetical protein
MNTLKTVYGKLFKEETKLASHEVELALIDDFKKLLNQANADYKEFNDDYNKFNGFKKLVIESGSKSEASLTKLDAMYSEIVKRSQEVGLRFSDTKEGKDYLNLVATSDPKIIKSLVDKAKTI